MSNEPLDNIAPEKKGRRVVIDLTERANSAIEGLRKLARFSTPDFFRYCISIGMQVISSYETGGRAYIQDKDGKIIPIPNPNPQEKPYFNYRYPDESEFKLD
jgi:hypothetical protein